MSTEIAPFDQQTSPAEIRKRVTTYLQKLENPAKGKQFLDYVKASKHIGWLVQNAAKKKEIYAAEIFTCWKLVELLDGMPKNPGQLKQGPTLQVERSEIPTYAELGLNYVEVHRWRRLHQAFKWEELEAEVNQFEKPTISAILGRIPFETILVVPAPGRYSIIYADPPWKYDFAQFQDLRIKYPTLTVEQIIDYEIDGKLLKRDYFDKDGVLFLWAAPPKLVEALTVLFDTQNTSSIVTNRLSKKDTINENKSLPVQANRPLREKTTVLPVLGLSRSAIFSCRASSHAEVRTARGRAAPGGGGEGREAGRGTARKNLAR